MHEIHLPLSVIHVFPAMTSETIGKSSVTDLISLFAQSLINSNNYNPTRTPIDLHVVNPANVHQSNLQFYNILKQRAIPQNKPEMESIPIKTIDYCNGVPRIMWMEDEVSRMSTTVNLQYAVIGKFTDGWLGLEELQE